MKLPVGGGTPVTLAAGQGSAYEIAVDAARVYWTASGNGWGSVMAVPLDGGSPITLASGPPGAYGIAVDATSVYWTVWGEAVMRLSPK